MTELHLPTLPTSLMAKAEQVARVMRLLSHPQRLCMLRHLAQRPRTVGELVALCGTTQPQVSQFIATLRKAGTIASTREGRHVTYSICDTRVLKVIRLVSDLYCTPPRSTPTKEKSDDHL